MSYPLPPEPPAIHAAAEPAVSAPETTEAVSEVSSLAPETGMFSPEPIATRSSLTSNLNSDRLTWAESDMLESIAPNELLAPEVSTGDENTREDQTLFSSDPLPIASDRLPEEPHIAKRVKLESAGEFPDVEVPEETDNLENDLAPPATEMSSILGEKAPLSPDPEPKRELITSDRLTWTETPVLASLEAPETPEPEAPEAEESENLSLNTNSTSAAALGTELSVGLPKPSPRFTTIQGRLSDWMEISEPISTTEDYAQTEDSLEEPELSPAEDNPIEDRTDSETDSEAIPIPIPTPEPESVIELTADRQQFDEQRQIFTAEGNVEMLFENAVLRSDKLRVNLLNRLALATGNASLISGDQIILGSRFLYNFVQGTGTVEEARGVVYVPTTSSDLDFARTTPDADRRTPGERILREQPPTDVRDAGGVIINVGGGGAGAPRAAQGGQVRRLRFEAARLDFTPEGWEAVDVRFTNDPFSPPELEVRADRAQLTRISPLEDEVLATRPRLVFDDRVSVPLLRNRLLISKDERDPALVTFGYDDRDRGGLFAERSFEVIRTRQVSLQVAPQFLIQRAFGFSTNEQDNTNTVEEDGETDSPLSWIGLRAKLKVAFTPDTRLDGNLSLAGLNNTGDTARGNLRLQHTIAKHTLSGEYSYRDRLYNGSLGFQTVDRSVGIVFASPIFNVADTGILVNYQASFQNVYAPTDRLELLQELERGDRVSLNRTQMSATVRRSFSLWKGDALPSTAEEGLKYTPKPVVPYLRVLTGLTGTAGFYSNGENQSYLQGLIGLQGQVGHFSKPWFDYTGFSLLYLQFIPTGESPFRFDRVADVRVLQLEVNQQLYGPLRVAARTSFNLDTGKTISTDYAIEYSRRTYGVTFRYNPDLGLAALGLRLGDFNWSGISESFSR
ncbi:DUF3769 domain-containing protein [Roseofilum casamattae]|uniref:DUF3769 domain-containing protein n=1 Tax=Roseofilum casamattae BLCC-M143 TaxID=3022442 RepID=A0ABT7BZA9_9CYAN|nr:DUF3769 domain-containing protein [Roseofilum casamattae]MDJ1184525.1 DUF3769 domain-containing protein [Roseofilum casamattae BLCC-M143]